MKILFIKPGMHDIIQGYEIHKASMEPLQLAILAALTPKDIDVVMYDDRIEDIPFDESTDLVAITVDTFTARRAYEISAEFKKRHRVVILGGIHVTLLPDEALQHADAIVTGDAENIWESVMRDAQQGTLKPIYKGSYYESEEGTIPRRDIFKNKKYIPISLVQFSRGCRHNCTYCSVSKYFNRTHICRNIDNVIREIEKDNLKRILFVDDNIVANKKKAKEFFRALIPLKIKWASQASINMVHDPELLTLMEKSGCVGHLIGFESINIKSLKLFNKVTNMKDYDNYRTAIQLLRDHGFLIWASFMLGNDCDTPDSIKETVQFAIDNKFTLSFFHILMPYPGTVVYETLKAENRLLYNEKWWIHPEFQYNSAVFLPKLFTPEELSKETVRANKAFYTVHSIASRATDYKTNSSSLFKLFLYLRFNLTLRNTSV